MGVYIKNMEMPKYGCSNCFLRTGNYCGRIEKDECVVEYARKNERHPDCPLGHVPPHGDLIDRNKLYEKAAELEAQALHMVEITMNDEDKTEWRKWSAVLKERSAFEFDVADAPTIIPAEED